MSITDYVADLEAIIEALGLKKVVLMGHSMNGVSHRAILQIKCTCATVMYLLIWAFCRKQRSTTNATDDHIAVHPETSRHGRSANPPEPRP